MVKIAPIVDDNVEELTAGHAKENVNVAKLALDSLQELPAQTLIGELAKRIAKPPQRSF